MKTWKFLWSISNFSSRKLTSTQCYLYQIFNHWSHCKDFKIILWILLWRKNYKYNHFPLPPKSLQYSWESFPTTIYTERPLQAGAFRKAIQWANLFLSKQCMFSFRASSLPTQWARVRALQLKDALSRVNDSTLWQWSAAIADLLYVTWSCCFSPALVGKSYIYAVQADSSAIKCSTENLTFKTFKNGQELK